MFSRSKVRRGTCQGGFSLLELVIVAAIMLVVAAIALPSVFRFVGNYRLKSSASQLAGMIQQCRINAVRTNSVIELRTNGQQIYIDLNGDQAYTPAAVGVTGEPTVQLPNTVTVQNAGFPGDATAGLGYVSQPAGTFVRFNARGIPCRNNAGACTTDGGSVGFVYYLRNRQGNNNTWAAVRVNPVGRITTVVWNGGSYK